MVHNLGERTDQELREQIEDMDWLTNDKMITVGLNKHMHNVLCDWCGSRLVAIRDELSKNTLIDILIDRATLEAHKDDDLSTDENEERILQVIEDWARPICNVRNDKMKQLRAAMMKWRQWEDRYRRQNGVVPQDNP